MLICKDFWGGVEGISHLWFLTAIAVCYAITPLLQYARALFGKWFICVVALSVFILIYLPQNLAFISSWLILYAIGYFLAAIGKKARVYICFMSVCVLLYLLSSFSWDLMMKVSDSWCITVHMFGAIVIVLVGQLVVTRIRKAEVFQPIKLLDKYSFHIYIVHHILIMPPFGMLHVTDYLILNILIIILYVLFFAWSLYTIEERFRQLISKNIVSH